ncbi:MAG: bifunctional demethylmenaquinone methyltransferase/2-methoxy-6-polyprenyl-1,4-benzoquinol methylase UbiE [Gammaproteobacteria bacterium]|nr:bifunctional demethylmenaquinone methyltransferase/2-methoxy-6-polyprenyl-1,4-benzoquinol methylase UbiE [Gammaproteobacteria bacterium]
MPINNTTHFGFQTIPKAAKASRVRAVFDSIANKYDLMNDLMSFGIHRLWKRQVAKICGVRKGCKMLDLAAGTGDLSSRFSRLVGPDGLVVFSDINNAMLEQGRSRMLDEGHADNIRYIQADAQYLPFPDDFFSCVTIGFGLRNVTHKQLALEAIFRVVKPGGRLMVLEFSKPTNKILEAIYDWYSFSLMPKIGKLLAKDEDSYRYLAESIRMHPDQETLKQMMEQTGFERCEYFNLTAGIVAIHRGYKG